MLDTWLDRLFPSRCIDCGRIGDALCTSCAPGARIERVLPTLTVRALGHYDGVWRRAVLALKNGRRDVAGALGRRIAALLDSSDATIVGVPTSMVRRLERGFDGGEMLARIAAQHNGVQSLSALELVAHDRQRGRNREDRLSARRRFCVRGGVLAGARVTLLDDVCTTGATLEDAASALRGAGAIVERAVVVASKQRANEVVRR